MTPKRKAVRCINTQTAIQNIRIQSSITTIKTIAACNRQTCATGRFSVNPYTGRGKLKNRLKSAVIEFMPVLENTLEYAGNLPDSEVFSRPESFGFGRDGLVRKAGRMAYSMFSTSRPPVALENAASGFQSQYGAETMTKVNTPTTPKAAPLGITPATFPGSVERQIAIETALADALHYIRLPYSDRTLNAATARTRRAGSLLKQACAEIKIGGAA